MNNALRIALVSAFPPGRQSLNEYGFHLAKGLAARADVAEVIVLADTLPKKMSELNLGPKVTIKRCWTFDSFANLPRLTAALHRIKADGVIWNLQMASFGNREATAALGLLAPMAARMTCTSSGVIAHNLVDCVDLDQTVLKGRRLRQMMVRQGARVITRALLSSTYLTVTLRGYFENLKSRFPNSPVHLVPHGTFDTDTNEVAPLIVRPRRIVTLGKFGTYKRLETLLAAFDLLRQTRGNSDLELVIGGSDHPNAQGYLAALAKERATDANVIFAGYVAESDIQRFFSDALMCVFDYTSTTGSSGVLHQASSFGTIPVFPRIGDFVDICEDEGIKGVNYAAQDPDDMAKNMCRALGDLETSQSLVDDNCAASECYPFEKVVGFHIDRIKESIAPIPAETRVTEAKQHA